MNVLVYMPSSVLSFHLETDMEIIKNLQDEGHNVRILTCHKVLKKSGYFSCKGFFRCQHCISKFQHAMDILGIADSQIDSLKHENMATLRKQDYTFNNLDELKRYTYKDYDVGMMTASTLISYLRDTDPQLKKFKNYINDSINTINSLCDFLENYLDKHGFDKIYLFNGRFNIYRALLRVAQKKGIELFSHERAGVLNRYSLAHNTYPHDLEYKKQEIMDVWENGDENKQEIGKEWFENSRARVSQAWYSYTADQKKGNLPEYFVGEKKIVSFFISSEDEFEAIQGWEPPLFKSQIEAIHFLGTHKDFKKTHLFVIRVHPNLNGLKNKQNRLLGQLNYSNVHVIPADDKTDSYSILDASDAVISFGSSVGIEASY